MAGSALCFSVMNALVKSAGARLPTMEIVLARSLVVLALCLWSLRSLGIPPWGNERRLLFVRGVVGSTALACSYYSVIHLPLAEATVIQYTNPVFTVLLAVPVLRESFHAVEALLILISLLGVTIVARIPFLTGSAAPVLDPLAVAVAVAGAVFSAGAYVMVRRLRREEPFVILFYFALVSALSSLPATFTHFVTPRGWEWITLLAVGVTTHLGQLSLTRGLQRERAGRATAVGVLQIVFAAFWGLAFFGEIPDAWTVGGAGLIVLSTLAIARLRPRDQVAADAVEAVPTPSPNPSAP
jgi:drug/metabolite transporter (DMT)-like permease